jgi:DNA polymerase III subunit alpha
MRLKRHKENLMNKFTHLHVHSQFSLLDGMCKIDELVQKTKSLGMTSLAITDHGNMFGAIKFYQSCKKHGINPIIGVEIYLAPRKMADKDAGIDNKMMHLILLAKNVIGYQNLLQIVSKANTQGFYHKARTDYETLNQHREGIICLTACLGGPLAKAILNKDRDEFKRHAANLQHIFKNNLYLELMDTGIPEQKTVNDALIRYAKSSGIPLVATNDTHYIEASDAGVQDVLIAIGTKSKISDPKRFKFETNQHYLKTPQEMTDLFKHCPEAITNTDLITKQCKIDIDLSSYHLPIFKAPTKEPINSYIRRLAIEALHRLYPVQTDEHTDRLNYELDTIEEMGFSGYFLIVADLIDHANHNDIPVGPARGSVAGSLVAYCLGITDVDPLKYGLIFERFLNPERISMPDIDIDFCINKREKVIDYVKEKYGHDHVALITTFGTLSAKAVVRDVARVLDVNLSTIDTFAKAIERDTLKDAINASSLMRKMINDDPSIAEVVKHSYRLEGLHRHNGIHAAGVLITPRPITSYSPLIVNKGQVAAQYAKNEVEDLGLLKMDFLGLRNLTVIDTCIKTIKENKNIQLNIKSISLADEKTFNTLQQGETQGVFQLESAGMTSLVKKLKPDSFEEIIALLALFRPGPLQSKMDVTFVKCKHGLQEIVYLSPQLEPILKETYGVILYQEQVMLIANRLAGFSLAEADKLRKAMGKKDKNLMNIMKKDFTEGCISNDLTTAIASELFDLIEKFAEYGFNKSHSTGYAFISYQTAYLKTHYPLEFMSALISATLSNFDKSAAYIAHCKKMDITVLTPDINLSGSLFLITDQSIRFGLSQIKNIGDIHITIITQERLQNGPFTNLMDFCKRIDLSKVNTKVIESLILAGTFDQFGNRPAQLKVLPEIIKLITRSPKQSEGQISLLSDDELGTIFILPEEADYPLEKRLSLEKELLGVYISGHPLDDYLKTHHYDHTTKTARKLPDHTSITLAGVIKDIKKTKTKNGDQMCFGTIEDTEGSLSFVLFPENYKKFSALLDQEIIEFTGDLSTRAQGKQLIINLLTGTV